MEATQITSLLVSIGKIILIVIAGIYLFYIWNKYSKIFIKWIRKTIRNEPEEEPVENNAEIYMKVRQAMNEAKKSIAYQELNEDKNNG